MSSTTPNMGLTKPDPDGSVGTWDTELNATIDGVDAHDHTTGKGVKVPVAGLNINSDLSFAGFGVTALKVVDLAAVLASDVTGYPTALFVNSADNELYWRTSGGVNVQLTSGTSLNAALLGGFTGDYGTGGSEANFNTGTAIYNFLRAANHRANIDCADVRLFQGSVGITNAVKLRSPNALAAAYEVVFPTALPAATRWLSMSAAGQLGFGRSPVVRKYLAALGDECRTGAMTGIIGTNGAYTSAVSFNSFVIPIPLEEGERLLSVIARIDPTASGTTSLLVHRVLDGALTQLGTTQVSSGAAVQSLTVSGLTEVVTSALSFYQARLDFTAAGHVVFGIIVTVDVP